MKEKVDLTGDVITPDKEPIKLQVGKTEFLESYKEAFKEEESKNELLKAGNLSIFSDTTKGYVDGKIQIGAMMNTDLTGKDFQTRLDSASKRLEDDAA